MKRKRPWNPATTPTRSAKASGAVLSSPRKSSPSPSPPHRHTSCSAHARHLSTLPKTSRHSARYATKNARKTRRRGWDGHPHSTETGSPRPICCRPPALGAPQHRTPTSTLAPRTPCGHPRTGCAPCTRTRWASTTGYSLIIILTVFLLLWPAALIGAVMFPGKRYQPVPQQIRYRY